MTERPGPPLTDLDGGRPPGEAHGLEPQDGAAPPFGGSWRNLYLAVLGNLALWIALMALATWAFS